MFKYSSGGALSSVVKSGHGTAAGPCTVSLLKWELASEPHFDLWLRITSNFFKLPTAVYRTAKNRIKTRLQGLIWTPDGRTDGHDRTGHSTLPNRTSPRGLTPSSRAQERTFRKLVVCPVNLLPPWSGRQSFWWVFEKNRCHIAPDFAD